MNPLAWTLALCLSVASLAAGAQPSPPPPTGDPIAEFVLPPELVLRHQKAIKLTEAQKTGIVTEVKRAQARLVELQWDLQTAMEALTELLARDRVDEAPLLTQLDKVLAAEREVKRTHLALAARLKNLLTPEQQQALRKLRDEAGRSR